MKLENQVVSLDLAKRLKELGVRQESLFYFKKEWYDPNPPFRQADIRWVLRCSYQEMSGQTVKVDEHIPAYTVAELGEMLPEFINEDGFSKRLAQYTAPYFEDITPPRVNFNLYYQFENEKHRSQPEKYKNHVHARHEADARAKLLIYLLENNLIK